ncbi:MAG: class I SAM-dependent methyltransferase [Spirochaetales bacterium]|nr:class I SAM-dependent methyltransferase [Spirochaetales bacterium]
MGTRLETIGARSSGLMGQISGRIMNLIHRRMYRRIIEGYLFEKLELTFGNTVLDIGCGGGAAVKLFSEMMGNSKICGIDYSDEMVRLAGNVNRARIRTGTVEINAGSVAEIPYEDGLFNIITAFDTINFWNDYTKAFSEIDRVLKENGVLVIVNGCPQEGSRWCDFVKFKTIEAYIDLLKKNCFFDVHAELIKNTVIVYGRKINQDRLSGRVFT